jgi:hypothetical protein
MMTEVYTDGSSAVKQPYAAPSIEVLGSLSELTLREKEFGTPNDGDFLHKESLTTIS